MKSFSAIIYGITIIAVIFNMVLIKACLQPNNLNILVKLGIIQDIGHKSFTNVVWFALIFSIITCVLLLVSFILLLKRLFFTEQPRFKS